MRPGDGLFERQAGQGAFVRANRRHMNEADGCAVRAGLRRTPIEQRVAKVASGISRKPRRKSGQPERPQQRGGRQRRRQHRRPGALQRPARPRDTRMIELRAAHVAGSGLDFETGRALCHPEMQDGVRLRPRDGLPRGVPRPRPLDRDRFGEQLDARQRGGIRERPSHRCGRVPRDAGNGPKPVASTRNRGRVLEFIPIRRPDSGSANRYLLGWGARNRTWEWRNQNPLPYRLATPHGQIALPGECTRL